MSLIGQDRGRLWAMYYEVKVIMQINVCLPLSNIYSSLMHIVVIAFECLCMTSDDTLTMSVIGHGDLLSMSSICFRHPICSICC